MMRRFVASISLGLAMLLSVCVTVYAAEKVELRGNDLTIVDKLNGRGLNREPSKAAVPGFGKRNSYLHSIRGEILGLGTDNSFHAFRENIDTAKVKHTRYQQMYKNIPVFAKELILHEDHNGKILHLNGNIVKRIEQDLDPSVPLVPAYSPTEALDHAKKQLSRDSMTKRRRHSPPDSPPIPETTFPASGQFNFRNEQSELNIYIDEHNQPRLVYYVNFLAEPIEGGEPTRPYLLIDAITKETIKSWEGLTHQAIGTGPGGNEKIGQYEYGTNFGYLDVLQNGTTCSMQNGNVTTVDLTGMSDSYASPFSYDCPRNTVKTVNGAYSPLNDAHYFGNIIVGMYMNWYGFPPITLPLVMRTHYSNNYENAFWDGEYMTFGDGFSTFYPLVSLDVAAHEVSHGFTEFNSSLIYEKESGGINESFSDMAGEAAEYYLRGSNDWQVGADIKKGSGALRYMDNPTADFHSIADFINYTDGLDVHYSSGLFNKVFYLLATRPGWTTKKAFDVMVKANKDYWVAASTFRSAACGAITAANDLAYSTTDVDNAFSSVNVYCGAPDITTTAIPPAVILSGSYTFTNMTASFSQTFSASAGTSPYTWSIVSGSLPSGLTLNSTSGEIYGTPAASGANRFTLQVMDSQGRKNFISWSIVVDNGLRTGWPKELQKRVGTGFLPESFSPVMADLDGDGKDEIIVGDLDRLYVFYYDGTSRNIVLPGTVTTPVVADLDGDGLKEIIVSASLNYSNTNTIHSFHSDLTPVTGFPAGSYSTYYGSSGFISSPVVADFNNDGELMIVVIASPNNTNDTNYDKNVVIMVDSQGQMVSGWPQTFGKYKSFDSPPAVGDIDLDGKKELVFATADGYIRIFRADGTLLNQWQLDSNTIETWSPVLADMDGDGFLDIVVKYHSSAYKSAITVLNRSGNLLPGWPKTFPANSAAPFGPIVADMDGDGRPEIIVDGNGWQTLHGFRGDGTYLPNWPIMVDETPIFDCYPVVADIDGDGTQELLITTIDYYRNGKLFAYTANGALLPDFPKYASPVNEIRSTAAIGDVDGNGKLDLVVKSENGFLYNWEMSQDGGGFARQWPMFRNNERHSGTWVTNRPGLTPATHDFQNVLSGSVSVQQTFTIRNLFDYGITLSSLAISGPDSSMFSITPGSCGNLPVSLSPLQSYTVNISFAPTGGGSRAAVLIATATSPSLVPAQALLEGTGTLSSYQLYYTRTGSGSGTVTSSTGTSYSSSGSETIPAGTVVTLTAAPAAGTVFTGWDGACTGTGDCTMTIDGDKQVIATFENSAGGIHQLNILRNGPENSAVRYSPGGACPSLCSHLYGTGAVVTLTPAHSADSRFIGWTGCDTVSGMTCSVTMTGAKTVTAFYKSIVAIAAASEHSLALKGDGTVWGWGNNNSGRLGDGSTSPRSFPVQTTELSGVIAIAAHGWHSAALKADGTVWTWGFNSNGALGDGTTNQRLRAGEVPGLSGVFAIAAGYFNTLALKEDGSVWSWGQNSSGQLGDGTTTDRLAPVQVVGLTGAVAIAAGDSLSVALKGDGTVWTWGNGYQTPYTVAGLSEVVAIAAGASHALALKRDGSLWAWGSNYYGQLGDGTTTTRTQPIQVPGVSGAVSIGAGQRHSIIADGNGTVKTWGYNSGGQIGDGTTSQHTSPFQVPGLSGIIAVDGGNSHSVALKGDGTIWGWGDNSYVQLGDGTNTNRPAPVQVQNINLDTTPPTTSASPGPGICTFPLTVTMTANEPATVYYTLDGSTPTTSSAVYIGPITINYGTTLKYFAKDVAGNSESVHTQTYDGCTLTISGTPASPTNSTSANLTISGTYIVSYIYKLDADSYSAETPVAIPISLSALSEGTHTVSALGKDNVGNWQEIPAVVSWTVDITPPVAAISGTPASPTNSTSATLSVGGTDVVSYQFKLDTGSYSAVTAVATTINLTSLSEATHTVSVLGKDAAGNWQVTPSAVNWTVDRTPPVAIISGTPTSPTNSTSATFTISGTDLVIYKYKLDTGSYSSEISVATPISLTSLSGTTHTVSVLGKDAAGNWQVTPTVVSWVVDMTPPASTISGTPTSPSNTADATLTVSGTDVITYKYKLDTGSYSTETSVTTPISLSSLSEATHTVSVLGKDTAGNWQVTPTTVSWTVDLTPPTATISGTPASPTNSTSATLTIAGTGVVTYKYKLDTGSYYAETAVATPVSLTSLSEATHTVSIIGKDAAGNWQTSPTTASWTVNLPPVTTMTTDPATANGTNGWFVTTPTVALSNSKPGTTYYRWGSASYDYSTQAQTWVSGGTAQNLRSDDTGNWYTLPFGFSFYGTTYTRVYLSSNGLMRFDVIDTAYSNSGANLKTKTAIAPLWDDLITSNRTGDDLYVFQPDPDSIGFRWQALTLSGLKDTNFETILYRDGRIRFNYDAQAGGLSATIGISKGDGISYHIPYDNNLSTTNNMASILYTPSAWDTYTTAITPISGDNIINYYSVDTLGASETNRSQHVKVDTVAPVSAASLTGGLYNSTRSVTLSCSDGTGSGCAGTYYCLGSACTPATLYNSAISITASTDLRFYSQDAAGNSEPVKVVTYTIDTAPPATTATPGSGTYNTMQNITLACNDSTGSGCATTYYCLGSGCTPATLYSNAISISASTDLRYYSRDIADNSEAVKTGSFILDLVPPTATITGTPASPTKTTGATLTVGGTDVVAYKYKLDAGGYSAETVIATHIVLSGLTDGTHAVSILGKNSAGNWQVIPTTVSWTIDLPVSIPGSSGYESILAAYNVLLSDNVLQIKGISIAENLVFDRNLTITLRGGFDPASGTCTGFTFLQGNLVIGNSTVIVENLVITSQN